LFRRLPGSAHGRVPTLDHLLEMQADDWPDGAADARRELLVVQDELAPRVEQPEAGIHRLDRIAERILRLLQGRDVRAHHDGAAIRRRLATDPQRPAIDQPPLVVRMSVADAPEQPPFSLVL